MRNEMPENSAMSETDLRIKTQINVRHEQH